MSINNNNSSNDDSGNEQTLNQNSTEQTLTTESQTADSPQTKTLISDLPQDVQDYIKDLREEAKKANKRSEAEARAKKQAEEQRLKEQGEYKKLAEQHEARVKELEPIAERYTLLSEQVVNQIKKNTKDWPTEVKAFYPGDDATVEQLNDWYTRSLPLIDKLQQQARSTQPGNAPNPRPAQETPEGTRNKFEQLLRSSGKYGA